MPSTRLPVHVTPRSSRDEVVGWRGSELQVKVTAPPDGGKANAAVCKLIADLLGIPKTSVTVVRGDASRHKVLEVGIGQEFVTGCFGEPDESLF